MLVFPNTCTRSLITPRTCFRSNSSKEPGHWLKTERILSRTPVQACAIHLRALFHASYRGTSLIGNRPTLGSYSRPMPYVCPRGGTNERLLPYVCPRGGGQGMTAGCCCVNLFCESAQGDEPGTAYAVAGCEHLARSALSLSLVDATGCCVYKAMEISSLSQEMRSS